MECNSHFLRDISLFVSVSQASNTNQHTFLTSKTGTMYARSRKIVDVYNALGNPQANINSGQAKLPWNPCPKGWIAYGVKIGTCESPYCKKSQNE